MANTDAPATVRCSSESVHIYAKGRKDGLTVCADDPIDPYRIDKFEQQEETKQRARCNQREPERVLQSDSFIVVLLVVLRIFFSLQGIVNIIGMGYCSL